MDPTQHHQSLLRRYWQMREQLDLAYRASTWDVRHIDAIAAELLVVERNIARAESTPSRTRPERDRVAPERRFTVCANSEN